MKCSWLIRNNNPGLVLLFSGWGGEDCLFREYRPSGVDFLVCSDYRDLDFDPGLLDGYDTIRVAGWSLGVWVASHVLQGISAPFSDRVAVNGTLHPVDDSFGIPVQVFRGTLERMDDLTLLKFRRRMCGSGEGLARFMSCGPVRTSGELKDELECLYRAVCAYPVPEFTWTRALTGMSDRIFPPENQIAAWQSSGTPVITAGEEHYSENFFRTALGCMPDNGKSDTGYDG